MQQKPQMRGSEFPLVPSEQLCTKLVDFWGVKLEHQVTLTELVGRPINLMQ